MKGLFVPAGAVAPGYVAALGQHIAAHDPGLDTVALTDIVPWEWPRLVGELSSAVLEEVFVGPVEAPWLGPRPDTPPLQPWMVNVAGVGGMLTESYRWQQIALDTEILDRAAGAGFGFYLRQEVGIDALGDHSRLRNAWLAYLAEVISRALARGVSSILWSPYAWDLWGYSGDGNWPRRRDRIALALSTLVADLRRLVGRNFFLTIDLQDGRGAQPAEPESDAVNWWRLIRNCGADEVRVNAEWFKPDLTPQDPEVMAARLLHYATENVPVGVCWSAREFLLPPPLIPQPIPNHSAIT